MATQQVFRALGTALVFKDSGGDAVITLQNLGFGVGRVSAQYDRGAGSKPMRHKWRGVFQFESAPVIGEIIEIHGYEASSTANTTVDGTVGVADAALVSAKRANSTWKLYVVVDTVSTGTDIVASGEVMILDRYFSVGVWNASAGDNLKNTANVNVITFTPMPDDIQAAA